MPGKPGKASFSFKYLIFDDIILMMKKLRIYIDTSVIGGYFDDEFNVDTRLLFDEILRGEYELVISDLTVRELVNAPEKVRTLLRDLKIDLEVIAVKQESIDLATHYIIEKVVGQTSLDDCIHIATATVHKLDLLVSWNFKHIVNVLRIRGYNSINLRNGCTNLEIRSPKNLINYEN
jgi:predicted nucleic acid-binding protein